MRLSSVSRLQQAIITSYRLTGTRSEYRSAELLNSYGIPTPKGSVAHNKKEAEQVASTIAGDDMVIKAQVLAGGRGKGHFDNGFKGGVQMVDS